MAGGGMGGGVGATSGIGRPPMMRGYQPSPIQRPDGTGNPMQRGLAGIFSALQGQGYGNPLSSGPAYDGPISTLPNYINPPSQGNPATRGDMFGGVSQGGIGQRGPGYGGPSDYLSQAQQLLSRFPYQGGNTPRNAMPIPQPAPAPFGVPPMAQQGQGNPATRADFGGGVNPAMRPSTPFGATPQTDPGMNGIQRPIMDTNGLLNPAARPPSPQAPQQPQFNPAQRTGTWMDDYLQPRSEMGVQQGFTGTQNGMNFINGGLYAAQGLSSGGNEFQNLLDHYGSQMRQLGIMR